MSFDEINICTVKMMSFTEDLKILNFSEMNDLIFNINKGGHMKDLNFEVKEEYFFNLFKVNLEGKLDNYDLNTILTVLKIFTNSNDLKHLENLTIKPEDNNQKLLESSDQKKKKFEEFKLEVEIPNFLEKVYFYLSQDRNLLIKYSSVSFVKNLCDLTQIFSPELLNEHYLNIIYKMLLLQINYYKYNQSTLFQILRTQSIIAFHLSLRENKENLKYHMKLFCKTFILLKSKISDPSVLKELLVVLNKLHNYIVIEPKNFENPFKNSKKTNFMKYIHKQTKLIKKEYEKSDKDRTHKQLKIMKHNLEEQEFV